MGPGERDGVEPYRGTYDGHWKDGKRHGWGEMIYPDGEEYNGMWADGCPVDIDRVPRFEEFECLDGTDQRYHEQFHTPSFLTKEGEEIRTILKEMGIEVQDPR